MTNQMIVQLTPPAPLPPVEDLVTITMSQRQARLLSDVLGAIGHEQIYKMFRGFDRFDPKAHQDVLKLRNTALDPLYSGLRRTLGTGGDGGRGWDQIKKDL